MNNITKDNYNKIKNNLDSVIEKIKVYDQESNQNEIKKLVIKAENLLLILSIYNKLISN